MAVRVLLLPGLFDSGPDHWQSHWERSEPLFIRVVQRDWERPRREDWVETLDVAVGAAGPDAVLVAHSTGCTLVAFWARETSHTVRGALLVAPSDTEAPSYPVGPTGWQPMPREALGFRSIVVASNDDPYCELKRAIVFAQAWGSAFVTIGGAGHINAASGLGDWKRGRRFLDELIHGTTDER